MNLPKQKLREKDYDGRQTTQENGKYLVKIGSYDTPCQEPIFYSGPGRSKLTMSLGNISLEFQTSVSQICQYF